MAVVLVLEPLKVASSNLIRMGSLCLAPLSRVTEPKMEARRREVAVEGPPATDPHPGAVHQ